MSSMYLFSIDTIETDIPTYIFSTCYECSHVIIGIFEIWSSPKQQQQHKRKTMSTWWICCEKKFWHVHFARMIKVNSKNICTFFFKSDLPPRCSQAKKSVKKSTEYHTGPRENSVYFLNPLKGYLLNQFSLKTFTILTKKCGKIIIF